MFCFCFLFGRTFLISFLLYAITCSRRVCVSRAGADRWRANP
jgi:hypothetical protein